MSRSSLAVADGLVSSAWEIRESSFATTGFTTVFASGGAGVGFGAGRGGIIGAVGFGGDGLGAAAFGGGIAVAFAPGAGGGDGTRGAVAGAVAAGRCGTVLWRSDNATGKSSSKFPNELKTLVHCPQRTFPPAFFSCSAEILK